MYSFFSPATHGGEFHLKVDAGTLLLEIASVVAETQIYLKVAAVAETVGDAAAAAVVVVVVDDGDDALRTDV